MNGGEEAGPAKCNFEGKCVVAYGALRCALSGFWRR